METINWIEEIINAAIIEIFAGFILLVIGAALGYWGLRRRVSTLENKFQNPAPVMNQTVYVGQPSTGPDKPISSTTVDRVEVISQEEFEALPVHDDKTIYITM